MPRRTVTPEQPSGLPPDGRGSVGAASGSPPGASGASGGHPSAPSHGSPAGPASPPPPGHDEPDSPQVIRVSPTDTRERKRRQREIYVAAGVLLGMLVGTWVELNLFGVDSYIFLVLLNINFILLLVVLFIVLRNGVKLILERRRRVFGSHLRTRLVLAFMALSLIPTVIMFLASNRVVGTSVDYWFNNQVEVSLDSALDVGRSFYTAAADRLRARGESMVSEITDRHLTWGGQTMDALLERKRKEYGLSLTGIVTPGRVEQNWHAPADFAATWKEARRKIAWDQAAAQRYVSLLWKGESADYVIGVLAIDGGRAGYLVLAESIGEGVMLKLERIAQGFDDYKKLKTLKRPLKVSFLFILAVLSLLIILGSIWYGFRLSKELTAPILALAEGTERIARGDLAFRLEDAATDELGLLVRSFNRMAEDLSVSRTRLTDVNDMLALQNVEMGERSRYIATVLDNIAAGVVSFGPDDRVATINAAACAMFGVEPGSIVGRDPREYLSPEDATINRQMLDEVRARPGRRWQRQIDYGQGDHALKLLLTAVSLTTPEGEYRGTVAVFEDITELERMQRMAAWREVARRIAHEIKNPLTPIKLSAQRLERKFAGSVDDPVFGQCTDLIVRQVEHLQQMVEEFSAFAKLPEVTPRPGDLTPLLEELTALFRNSHSNIAWTLDIPAPLPVLPMDHEALHRAFLNILTNAAEVLQGRDNGVVTITAVHNTALNLVRVDVADNGPGLTAEERSRLFEPYFSRKKGGTGLGLTIVKSVVSDHRGYVRAHAVPVTPGVTGTPGEADTTGATGGGTVVTVELPVA
jgi:two-component system nitrogen regulation sensor histidine kinase NtrY